MTTIQGVQITELSRNHDVRGWLAEIYRVDAFGQPVPLMAYVSLTEPGVVRGPHEHSDQTDMFVFLTGNWKVKLWDSRPNSATTGHVMVIPVKTPTRIIVPPGVIHAYANINRMRPGLVLNLPNRLYKGHNKQTPVDETRWENTPAYCVSDLLRKSLLHP